MSALKYRTLNLFINLNMVFHYTFNNTNEQTFYVLTSVQFVQNKRFFARLAL